MATIDDFLHELSDLGTTETSNDLVFEEREAEVNSVESFRKEKKPRTTSKDEQIEGLEQQIEELKHENQALKNRVDELTAQKDLNALRYQVLDMQETIDQLRKDKLALEMIQRNQAKQLLESDIARSYGCMEEGFTREIMAWKQKVKSQQKRIDQLQRETISKSTTITRLRKKNKELETIQNDKVAHWTKGVSSNQENQEGNVKKRISTEKKVDKTTNRQEEHEEEEEEKEGVNKLQRAFVSLRKKHHHAVRSLDKRLESMQREHEQKMEKIANKTQEVSKKHQEEGLRKMRLILNQFLKKQKQQRVSERLSSRSRASSPFTPPSLQTLQDPSAFDSFSIVPSIEYRVQTADNMYEDDFEDDFEEVEDQSEQDYYTTAALSSTIGDASSVQNQGKEVSTPVTRSSSTAITPRPPSSPKPSNMHEKRRQREKKREEAKQAFLSSKSP